MGWLWLTNRPPTTGVKVTRVSSPLSLCWIKKALEGLLAPWLLPPACGSKIVPDPPVAAAAPPLPMPVVLLLIQLPPSEMQELDRPGFSRETATEAVIE